MYSILVQQDAEEGIFDNPKYHEEITPLINKKFLEKAYISIILQLVDNVIRQVNKERTALEAWKKLDELFFLKSLSSHIRLKV